MSELVVEYVFVVNLTIEVIVVMLWFWRMAVYLSTNHREKVDLIDDAISNVMYHLYELEPLEKFEEWWLK